MRLQWSAVLILMLAQTTSLLAAEPPLPRITAAAKAKQETLSASDAKIAAEMLAKEAEVRAAEAKAGTSAASAPDAGKAAATTKPAVTAKGNPDFVPTVKINEDLPVAFPADI